MYYEALDDAVTLWRKKNGVSQEKLAEMMGMAPNTLMWKLRGERDFTLPEARKLADLVGVTLDGMAGREYRPRREN